MLIIKTQYLKDTKKAQTGLIVKKQSDMVINIYQSLAFFFKYKRRIL